MNFEDRILDCIKITIIVLIIMIIGSEVFSKETGIEPPIVDGELIAYDYVYKGYYLEDNNFQSENEEGSVGQAFVNNKFVTYKTTPRCGNLYNLELTYQDGTVKKGIAFKNQEGKYTGVIKRW